MNINTHIDDHYKLRHFRIHRKRSQTFIPSDIPQYEADALITLYDNGNGDSWINNAGWKIDPIVDNWYGITVSNGHVTRIVINSNNGSGDISAFNPSIFGSLTRLYLYSNSFSGNLSWWKLPNSLQILYLQSNSFSGDLSNWTIPNSSTTFYIYNNNFNGDLSSWTLPSSLQYFRLNDNSFSGDLSEWILPSSLIYMYIYSNSFSGNLSSWTLPSSLQIIYLNDNSFSGNLSNWTIPNSLRRLYLYNCSFNGVVVLSTGNLSLQMYRIYNNGLSQTDVDGIAESIYNRRADFTYATPLLDIYGSNSTPSGIYQDGDPPTTGKEYIYEIENDPEIEGFNVWSVTYTS